MPDWLEKIADIVKLPIKYFWTAIIFCSILLLLPESYLQNLGLKDALENYKPWISITLFFSFSVVLYELVSKAIDYIKNKQKQRTIQNKRVKVIEELDHVEIATILEFYIQSKNTFTMVIDDPTVAGLMSKNILQLAGSHGYQDSRGKLMPVRINPHIKNIIEDVHDSIISEAENIAEQRSEAN